MSGQSNVSSYAPYQPSNSKLAQELTRPSTSSYPTSALPSNQQQSEDYMQQVKRRLSFWFNQPNVKPVMQIKHKDHRTRTDPQAWTQQQRKRHEYQIAAIGSIPTEQLVDYEVCYLELSLQEPEINSLRSRPGTLYTDKLYPPDQVSLKGEEMYVRGWENIVWNRLSVMLKGDDPIFRGMVSPNDIKQGMLGDCYYLAALAALAERPTRIYNLFLVTETNAQKWYACKILYKGKWKTILLDDFIPVLRNNPNFPAFSRDIATGMWVSLLEKAWAKMYSSFKRIAAGYAEEGLHDLTGAHVQAIRIQSEDFDKEQGWKYLRMGEEKGYAMVGSTLPGSDQNIPITGVVLGHAYTVLSAIELQFQGAMVRLVKCRNPWGQTESTLDWNDKDPKWNLIPQSTKDQIGFVNRQDGTFFISYDDFCKQFRMVTSAEVDDNASYVYFTQKSQDKKGKYFFVNILREGEYSFQINQTPSRRFLNGQYQYYRYVPATILIGRVNSTNMYEYFEGSQSAYRTLFKKHWLPVGHYVIYGQIMFDTQWQQDFQVTLAIYCSTVCDIGQASPAETTNYHQRLFLSRAMRTAKLAAPGIYYSQEILREGYLYAAVFNQSNKPIIMSLTIKRNTNPTVYVLPPNNGKSEVRVEIQPGKNYIVLGRIVEYYYTTSALGDLRLYFANQ